MISILVGSIVLSILHAIIPNHWLPVLAVGKKENWDLGQMTRVTFLLGLSHASSTVLIGFLLAFIGEGLSASLKNFTALIAPSLLIVLGAFYIYQHMRHHHFHLHGHPEQVSKSKLVFSLATAMFLSPCFEIEAYFLVAGAEGLLFVVLLATLYTLITVSGMVLWVRLAFKGMQKMNWHSVEHNAGIITGITLIVSGVISFFIR
jgi:putative Mn2+ efflux pump MntP